EFPLHPPLPPRAPFAPAPAPRRRPGHQQHQSGGTGPATVAAARAAALAGLGRGGGGALGSVAVRCRGGEGEGGAAVRLAGPVVPAGPGVRPGPRRAARQDGAGPPRGGLVRPRRGRVARVRRRLPAPPGAALRGPHRRQGPPPVRLPRLVLRRPRLLPVHPPGPRPRPTCLQEQQGVRGVVPERGAEQHPVVLPEGRRRAPGHSAEEAPAIHPGDRRPLLRRRLRRQGPPLRLRCVGGEPHGPCTCPLRAQGADGQASADSIVVLVLFTVEFDIEGGGPIKMKTKEANVDGFLTEQQENRGYFRYVAPCTFYGSPLPREWFGHADAGEEEEEAPVHDGVHVRPSGAGEEQGDLGLPEERRPLARQDHTAVVLPHGPERPLGLGHVPPPRRGA
uniref:Uncharacterized protein n=1 Tax=Aegilops tauschii subsp. strangulata TaxID=200361 RepID=A0A453M5P0_AEGTS